MTRGRMLCGAAQLLAASCMSPSEKASCFRPWSLSGPEKDAICGASIPPR